MQFPVTIHAEFRGLARRAGDFVAQTGEKISYGDAYRFEFEDSNGVVQDVSLAVAKCDDAAAPGLDVAKLAKGDQVVITGNVGAGDRGIYLSPTSIEKAEKAVRAAA